MWHRAEGRSADGHVVSHAQDWLCREDVGGVGKRKLMSSWSREVTIKLRLASRSGPCPLCLPLRAATRGIYGQIPHVGVLGVSQCTLWQHTCVYMWSDTRLLQQCQCWIESEYHPLLFYWVVLAQMLENGSRESFVGSENQLWTDRSDCRPG